MDSLVQSSNVTNILQECEFFSLVLISIPGCFELKRKEIRKLVVLWLNHSVLRRQVLVVFTACEHVVNLLVFCVHHRFYQQGLIRSLFP